MTSWIYMQGNSTAFLYTIPIFILTLLAKYNSSSILHTSTQVFTDSFKGVHTLYVFENKLKTYMYLYVYIMYAKKRLSYLGHVRPLLKLVGFA